MSKFQYASRLTALSFAFPLAATFAAPAHAQLLERKDLSLHMALTIADAALQDCKAKGYATSVVVVDRAGETMAACSHCPIRSYGPSGPPPTPYR